MCFLAGVVVSLDDIVSEVSPKNKNKTTVECGSTNKVGVLKRSSKEIKDGMTDTRGINTGKGRTPSYSEIVMKNINSVLSSSEGQAIGKPSEQSLSKLIKI